jgi:MarR family transcriptional regulator, transcriptional regulator for hemolysin
MQSKNDKAKNDKASWAPERTVAFWVNRASRLLLRIHDERLRPLGFSMGQLPVLDALADGAARSQKEIAERAGVKQPSMAEMLARMERQRIVRRAPDPNDGRGSLISLSPSALGRIPEARSQLMRGERDAVAGLTTRETEAVIALLRRVVANLHAIEAAGVDDTAGDRPGPPRRSKPARRRVS